jgi:hypothetical protein
MSPSLYLTLLTLSCGYAMLSGRLYERLAAAVCIAGTIATVSVNAPMTERYVNLEGGALLVDAAVLAAFVSIALNSDRFWPLWVAGLQLVTSFSHLLKTIDPGLVPPAYGAAVRIWSYPILALIAIGTRNHQRRLKAFGADPSWTRFSDGPGQARPDPGPTR